MLIDRGLPVTGGGIGGGKIFDENAIGPLLLGLLVLLRKISLYRTWYLPSPVMKQGFKNY